MPAPGQITSKINQEAAPAHQEFVLVLRRLCQLIIGSKHGAKSQKAICEELLARGKIGAISQPTLTSQLNASRRPDPHLAKELYALAAEAAESDPGAPPLPVTLAELEGLYTRALVKHCSCCPDSAGGTVSAVAGPVNADDPPALAARAVVPVPPAEGDRQHTGNAAPAWAAQIELERYLQAGRSEDIRLILRHVGTTRDLVDVVDTVAACRAAELDDAADTILHHAGRREPGDILRVAKLLITHKRHADAGILLGAIDLG